MTESVLTENFIKYLESKGYSEIVRELNLGYNSSFVDCVYLDENRNFICVELKLRDWRKVIKQANKLLKLTDNINSLADDVYKSKIKIENLCVRVRFYYVNKFMFIRPKLQQDIKDIVYSKIENI